jgi:hypothetical protein
MRRFEKDMDEYDFYIKNIKIFNMEFINEMDNQQPILLVITIRFND